MNLCRICTSVFVAVVILSARCNAQTALTGIKDQKAPKLTVDKWVQLPKTKSAAKKKAVDISDYKGKVVYMFLFQSACPGCRDHGFPTMQKLKKKYKDDKQVAFVAIQTVNEGHSVNTPDRAKQLAKKFELDGIAIGHSDSRGKKSIFNAYKPGGTPWVAVIDKQGIVRHNDYFVDPDQAIKVIDSLKSR